MNTHITLLSLPLVKLIITQAAVQTYDASYVGTAMQLYVFQQKDTEVLGMEIAKQSDWHLQYSSAFYVLFVLFVV